MIDNFLPECHKACIVFVMDKTSTSAVLPPNAISTIPQLVDGCARYFRRVDVQTLAAFALSFSAILPDSRAVPRAEPTSVPHDRELFLSPIPIRDNKFVENQK